MKGKLSCMHTGQITHTGDHVNLRSLSSRYKDNKSPLPDSTLGHLGPVVESIVSLTSSLRGQLIKCLMTL